MSLSIEEQILQDPHVLKILPGEKWAFQPIDYELFTRPFLAQQIVETIQNSLQNPYIIDDFQNHSARRDWRSKIPSEQYRWLQNNSLRGAMISHFFNGARFFTKDIKVDDEGLMQFANIVTAYIGCGDFYDALPTQEKVDFMRELKQNMFSVLDYLSNMNLNE